MGANYREATCPLCDEQELKEKFRAVQEAAAYNDGYSYSGNWNMCDGLRILPQTFDSREAAEKYVIEEQGKWGPAFAVKYKKNDILRWYIGAWCAE